MSDFIYMLTDVSKCGFYILLGIVLVILVPLSSIIKHILNEYYTSMLLKSLCNRIDILVQSTNQVHTENLKRNNGVNRKLSDDQQENLYMKVYEEVYGITTYEEYNAIVSKYGSFTDGINKIIESSVYKNHR